jgi:2-aminoethylphosphonate-pyruvate transaminase
MIDVKTAVILAAGLGSRLKDRTKEMPKAFLEIGGQSLIERSIQSLLNKGINRIIIGTGYLSHHFDRLKIKYKQLETYRNAEFATTGSMFTLFNLRHLIDQPFLLLEGDLLYDPIALNHLLADSGEDIILASTATHSGDEVYIQRSPGGFLEDMSKDKSKLKNSDAELVGISKVSVETLQDMVAFSDAQYEKGNKAIHYEDALVGISTKKNIFVKVIDNLAWCEIDDEDHLERALRLVYPRISAQNLEN